MYRSFSLKASLHRGISRRATRSCWSPKCWTGWRRSTSWPWRVLARTVTCQAASRSGPLTVCPWPSLPWPPFIIVQGALHAFLTSQGSDNRFPETVRLCIKAGGCNCSRANYAGALVSSDKWEASIITKVHFRWGRSSDLTASLWLGWRDSMVLRRSWTKLWRRRKYKVHKCAPFCALKLIRFIVPYYTF